MNEIELFYDELNQSNYDRESNSHILSELNKISTNFNTLNDFKNLEISETERMAFAIQKSFSTTDDLKNGTVNGLNWSLSGIQTLNDKSTQPFYWPDVRNLTQANFDYFENRYKTCKNLYAKTEFGLLVYFGSKTKFSKHIEFKKTLFKELFDLSQDYLKKSKKPDKTNFYTSHYFVAFKTAFLIAHKSKIKDEINQLVKSLVETHSKWNIRIKGTFRILYDLSKLSSEYYNVFKHIDYEKIISKNIKAIKYLEKTNINSAIDLLDVSIEISKKNNLNINYLLEYKAELYLKLSFNAEKNKNIASVQFTERALRLYEQVKNTEKILEVEKRYSEQRGKFRLAEIKEKLPQDDTDKIISNIQNTIESSNELDVIYYLIFTPWYDKIENIKASADDMKKRHPLMAFFGSSILDKYGNTIDTFQTEEEKNSFNFWQSYGYSFQIGTQTMLHFFILAFKEKKISYNSVINYLETTWLNDIINRKYSGHSVKIIPLDLIRPSIKRFFEELDNYHTVNNYQIDFVIIIDSLVLKIESLIRFYCEKIGIATFKTRQKGNDKLVMEKLLDDLLFDVEHSEKNITGFDEEDRILIKYVLTEKAGWNLRNEVAHGLMDIYDYDISKIIVVLSIILKISKYNFAISKK